MFKENAVGVVEPPDDILNGVGKSITQICANISHQIYYVKESSDFDFEGIKVSPAVKVVIYDDHGEKAADETNPKFIVAVAGDTLVMGWRGTHEPMDFLTDANFAPVSASELGKFAEGIKCHGMFSALVGSDLFAHQEDIVKKHMDGIKTIVFTGHSLGGGMASVAHLFIQAQINGDAESVWKGKSHLSLKTVTFAAPSSMYGEGGSSKNASGLMKTVGEHTFNFVFGPDIVPRVYGHTEYIKYALKEVAAEVIHFAPRFVGHMAASALVEKLEPMFPVMEKYRHQGTLLYYEQNETTKPVELKDTGGCEDETEVSRAKVKVKGGDEKEVRQLKYYTFGYYTYRKNGIEYTYKDGKENEIQKAMEKFNQSLGHPGNFQDIMFGLAHSYFPEAFATRIKDNEARKRRVSQSGPTQSKL